MLRRGKTPSVIAWLKCPRCSSGVVYYRAKKNDYLCRKCGAVFKASFSHERVTLTPKGE